MKHRSRLYLAVLAAGVFGTSVLAKDPTLYSTSAHLPEDQLGDRPIGHLVDSSNRGGLADTLGFGYIAGGGALPGGGFAVAGDVWTFDHDGLPLTGIDPFEGWTSTDLTQQNRTFWRHITAGIWTNGDPENGNVPTGNLVNAPILSGVGSAWVGAFQNEADDLCWLGGLGYGNSWCQELRGPVLNYDGTSTITIDFDFFNDTEEDFDYGIASIQTLPSGNETELIRFTGQIGLAPDHPASPPVGQTFNFGFSNFQTDTAFRLVFRMQADGGWADEDGQYTTEYGPFGTDNVGLGNTGAGGNDDLLFTFESDLEGWAPVACPGFGSFEGIAAVSNYTIEDPCVCELSGNVLEHHDDNLEHPYGQNVEAKSNPVDVENDVVGNLSGTGQLEIFADWSQYSIQPRANGVFYRPGWDYFPFLCPATGATNWSGRVGQATYFSTGDDAVCFESRNIATDHGIPSNVEQIRFIHEIIASCDGFAIPPEECTEITNFTPIIDNIQIRFTLVPEAPSLFFNPGDQFVDGFVQGLLLDPNGHGNADQVGNVNGGGNSTPIILGDSLHVGGPVPTGGFEYDARLWFRVARRGPGTDTAGYDAWRTRVQMDGGLDAVDGVTDIEAGDFATAKMDSSQIGVNASSSKFHSYFIEQDARFDGGAGEITAANEIIADGILLPGTSIEYFITSNYVTTPENFFLLPDTSGGFYREFEILPNWRDDNGTLKFPCLLYVDAFNNGAQFFVEEALNVLGFEADRYDYADPSSSWKAPMARGLSEGANNGCTTFQLLGYRAILLNTGNTSGNVLWPQDYAMLSDWLETIACDANSSRQGLLMNGDNMASILNITGPALLNGPLATVIEANTYSGNGNLDENYCVQLEAPSVGSFAYGTSNSQNDYEYGAWGNWCPQQFSFDVLGTIGSGVGNRAYVNVDTAEETNYAQTTNERSAGSDNFRTVLDGVSWHHLSERDVVEECVGDSAHIVTAAFNEISAALEWIFGVGNIPNLCTDPCEGDTGDAPEVGNDAAVTHLFQNSPNPFNPYTTLHFSLAAGGPAGLAIYDVSGRRVRTLVDGILDAGSHEVVWDGTNDAGEKLASGVYWSQFEGAGTKSNKKMVMLTK